MSVALTSGLWKTRSTLSGKAKLVAEVITITRNTQAGALNCIDSRYYVNAYPVTAVVYGLYPIRQPNPNNLQPMHVGDLKLCGSACSGAPGLEKSFPCQSQNFSGRARVPFFWSQFLSSWSQSCAKTQKFRRKKKKLSLRPAAAHTRTQTSSMK